ncbi:sushi domain-containing protein 2-like [Amphiura filiformis]|uniref:sushi domain-containing protein 2-like n=1 Tax=Amphiura filiformis TaxID=82378 RepID=UPI003B20E166
MDTHWASSIFVLIISATSVQSAANLYSYGTQEGDLIVTQQNDGYRQINFTQGFPFYSYLFKTAYINENGLVSMLTPVNQATWKEPFPIDGTKDNNGDGMVDKEGADARVIIAPFWANVDVSEAGRVYFRQINDTEEDVLKRATEEVRTCFLPEGDFTPSFGIIITWADVSFFGHSSSTTNPRNTFQLVLASDGRKSFAIFLYDKIEWNAGTESQGSPEYGKSSRGATVGFNVGDRYKSLSHTRSGNDYNSQSNLPDTSNCPSLEQQGVWFYRIDQTEMDQAGCESNADLAIFPSVGSMFGGEKIYLDGPCYDSNVEILCRFKYNNNELQEVSGERIDNEKAYCIPEPFFLSGELTIEVSTDGGANYQLSATYYVANLDRISSSGVTRANPDSTNWDRSDYDLSVSWDPSEFGDNVNISISALVYQESGSDGPEWEEVYDIAVDMENSGVHNFEGVAVSQVYEENAFGAIRIRETDNDEGRTLWSDVHMLGYLLNDEYQDNPPSWSRRMCDEWAEADDKLPSFVENLFTCPCTLQQAIVDTGRFQPDAECSMFDDGSKCLYHTGAKHCVISVAATIKTNSGSECCYNQNGDLMYAGDTRFGSTGDRSHVWGAEPYQEPGMVPSLSHWYHDVRTWYYCCVWGDDCNSYLERRPTPDCKEYIPPKTSATFGDPHFVTFDGVEYTFNGKGEYTMIQESDSGYELQVRTEQAECSSCNSTDANATVVTAIAMGEPNSDTIHVELNSITVLKFIRKVSGSTEVVDFYGQEWLDFTGVSIIVMASDKGNVHQATITYWDSGIGVNVTANGQTLSVATTLPPSLKDNTDVKGLLGSWDGNSDNDLKKKDGTKLNPDTVTAQQILDFGISWELENSLFYYEIGNHDMYQDNDFVPVFDTPDRSTLPDDLVEEMDRICGTSKQCLYDVSITRTQLWENTLKRPWKHI